jgi:hypothetical protein
MEVFIGIAVSILLEALNTHSVVQKNAARIAKVFVAIERFAESSPVLTGAIEAARRKP